MTLLKHCCSRKLAKELKKAGIHKQSQYTWCKLPGDSEPFLKSDNGTPHHQNIEYYSAYTLSELAGFFPRNIEWYSGYNIEPKKWSCAYKDQRVEKVIGFNGKTEVDARAKLLLHLLKTGKAKVK